MALRRPRHIERAAHREMLSLVVQHMQLGGVERAVGQSDGGGSILAVDDAGALHVGPHSAGAAPGPVCYGNGGPRRP